MINQIVRAGALDFTEFTQFLTLGKPTPEAELAGDTRLLGRQYCEDCEELLPIWALSTEPFYI